MALHDAIKARQTATAHFWRDEIALRQRLNVGGEFWADAVARLKREKRYMEAAVLCRQAMPVPAAYEHLLICLRKLYKKGGDNRLLLGELYAYAVEADVLFRIPYVEFQTAAGTRGLPGFNVASIVWQWLKEQAVVFPYKEFGYEKVTTLNKTDRTRLALELGAPMAQEDPFDVLRPLWDRGVEELARREAEMDRAFRASLKELLSPPKRQ